MHNEISSFNWGSASCQETHTRRCFTIRVDWRENNRRYFRRSVIKNQGGLSFHLINGGWIEREWRRFLIKYFATRNARSPTNHGWIFVQKLHNAANTKQRYKNRRFRRKQVMIRIISINRTPSNNIKRWKKVRKKNTTICARFQRFSFKNNKSGGNPWRERERDATREQNGARPILAWREAQDPRKPRRNLFGCQPRESDNANCVQLHFICVTMLSALTIFPLLRRPSLVSSSRKIIRKSIHTLFHQKSKSKAYNSARCYPRVTQVRWWRNESKQLFACGLLPYVGSTSGWLLSKNTRSITDRIGGGEKKREIRN